jgi:hypothetical protein
MRFHHANEALGYKLTCFLGIVPCTLRSVATLRRACSLVDPATHGARHSPHVGRTSLVGSRLGRQSRQLRILCSWTSLTKTFVPLQPARAKVAPGQRRQDQLSPRTLQEDPIVARLDSPTSPTRQGPQTQTHAHAVFELLPLFSKAFLRLLNPLTGMGIWPYWLLLLAGRNGMPRCIAPKAQMLLSALLAQPVRDALQVLPPSLKKGLRTP